MSIQFLHQLPDVKKLFAVIAKERNLLPEIVEKDYWLMHCLWGIQQQGFKFELKGGTSLSKGFGIIDRFSEDIDIQVHPMDSDDVKTGKNHNKSSHIKSRRLFFDEIAKTLKITDLTFMRDYTFDEPLKMRSAGIRAEYLSHFNKVASLKSGIVLELGFDQTTPNLPCDISSWAFEKVKALNIAVFDNSAKKVRCYCPEYTFVEKLQTVSTKYRLQQANKTMPVNFLRHYYDIYKLLQNDRVIKFIGSDAYLTHKQKRFRTADEQDIQKNPAFTIPNTDVRKLYAEEFNKKSSIYFAEQPSFDDILQRIQEFVKMEQSKRNHE